MKLQNWVDALIVRLMRDPRIYEGWVRTMGPAPYRRIDCHGRALAYVRAVPTKGGVRIDFSSLWNIPRSSRLAIRSVHLLTLFVTEYKDLDEAVALLRETVDATLDG